MGAAPSNKKKWITRAGTDGILRRIMRDDINAEFVWQGSWLLIAQG